jgi:hypothetical protein
MEFIKEIVSKDIKVLNDINQVVKKSFLHYFIARNGVVITDDKGLAIDNGAHFSFIEDTDKLTKLIDIPEKHLLMLEAPVVYTHYKDQKKHIKYMKVNDEGVFLSGENGDVRIGKIIEVTPSIQEAFKSAVDKILVKSEELMTDDLIEAMLRNEIVTYGEGEYKVRLTKTLFPHIKIGLPITVTHLDVEDPNLFQVMLSITKDKITNFHVYTCIKY